jgi:hypothetical protein
MSKMNIFRMLKSRGLVAAFLFASFLTPGVAQHTPPKQADEALARSIVEKVDRVRFPAEGFQVDVEIVTTRQGQRADARRYRVLSKGNENTVVTTTEPAAERGQSMLMKGRDLWVFMPTVSQPIRLSLARANFTGDYAAVLLRNEVLEGESHHVLELTAVDRSVTYQKVVLWVKQANAWPHKAEFYSLSNKLLKTARYEKYQTMAGRTRPTRMVMEDALRQGEQSVLEYSGMTLRELPDKVFTKDYLKRLE